MIKIHATKKLFAKLPVSNSGELIEPKNPLSGWHANLITLQRRNCILMVHDSTRFPLFIPCLTKPDFSNINWYFEDALMNTLLKLGANQQQLDTAISLLGELSFDTTCDRSVQGTMNQMKGDIEYMLRYENANVTDLSAYRTAVWLSDRPCTVKTQKKCIWPQKAMLALLSVNRVSDDMPSIE